MWSSSKVSGACFDRGGVRAKKTEGGFWSGGELREKEVLIRVGF